MSSDEWHWTLLISQHRFRWWLGANYVSQFGPIFRSPKWQWVKYNLIETFSQSYINCFLVISEADSTSIVFIFLQEDFLKWKGSLFFRFVTTVVDADPEIKAFGESSFISVCSSFQYLQYVCHGLLRGPPGLDVDIIIFFFISNFCLYWTSVLELSVLWKVLCNISQ